MSAAPILRPPRELHGGPGRRRESARDGGGELNARGKWTIIGVMFIGRAGPTSLALSAGNHMN